MSRGKSIMVKIHEKWRTISYGRVGSLQRPKLSIHLSQHVVQEIAWSLGPGGYDTKWLIVIKEDAHITKVVIRREEIVHSPVVVYNVFLRLVTMNCIPTPRVLLWDDAASDAILLLFMTCCTSTNKSSHWNLFCWMRQSDCRGGGSRMRDENICITVSPKCAS